MKNLAELQAECDALGINVVTRGRASKEPYVAALRDYHWRKDHPDQPLPAQTTPMLLGSWENLEVAEAEVIEDDHHAWIVQPKIDGVRALLHIEGDQVRITSRMVSEATYRLSEFQDNLPHLAEHSSRLNGAILDGELVCPVSRLDTGSSITESSLQATMAVLAAAPNKAQKFQEGQNARLRFHAFDILHLGDRDLTRLPLMDRQVILENAVRNIGNSFIEPVPSVVVGKTDFHRRIINAGGEGTVWKRANSPYEPGRRVNYWLKRKRGIEIEAFIIGFKPGSNGHTGLIGAIEFGVREPDGSTVPIAWISSLSDAERSALTNTSSDGSVSMGIWNLGRRALISGQELSARARRFRHARLVRWIDPIDVRTR